MILGDAGSTWTKVFAAGDQLVRLLPTRELARSDLAFDWGTGHTARRRSAAFENDLISLARGVRHLVAEERFVALDLGSRDAKLVEFRGARPRRLDWSAGCAAATGATLEMIGRFHEVDFTRLPVVDRTVPVTCGTYALERVMDDVACGLPVEEAIAALVNGVARNAFEFAGRPARLHLSGGFTANPAFLAALRRHCEVISLGRTAPLVGLWLFAADRDPTLGPVPGALHASHLLTIGAPHPS